MPTPLPIVPRSLPCYPCPHGAACCSFGTTLSDDEAATIRAIHGDRALAWDAEFGEWRTAVASGRCVFLEGTLCTIHAEPYYPAICRGFPWSDGRGGPYLWDATACPEMPQDEEDEGEGGPP